MQLFLWEYDCVCGNVFKLPELDEFTYGDFILRNNLNEMRYLVALNNPTFKEVSKLVFSSVLTEGYSDYTKSDIFQNIFYIACDKAIDGSIFIINNNITCPSCRSKKMKSWQQLFPFEIVDVDVPEVTYNNWHTLSLLEKKDLVHDAILKELEKMKAAKKL